MANSRYLSICKLLTTLLISTMISGITFANPAQSAFREKDIMVSDEDKEHVFHSLLLSAVNADSPKKLWPVAPNDEIRNSLTKIRNARFSSETAGLVQLDRISDLVYAYSWSDTAAIYFLGSSIVSVENKIADFHHWIGSKTDYRNGMYSTAGAAGVATAAGLGLKKICKKGAPAAPQAAPAATTPFSSKIKSFLTETVAGGLVAAQAWLVSHPILPGAIIAYEVCADVGNIFIAGPYALDYYTDRVILDGKELHGDTWANTIYQYQDKTGQDYYRGYINMDTYYKLLKNLLNVEGSASSPKVHFSYATEEVAKELDSTYRAKNLYGARLETSALGLCSTKATPLEYKNCVAANREKVKKVVSDSECRKYTLFNRRLHPEGDSPLFLFALCGTKGGDGLVFAKMPGFHDKYARISKESVPDFVNDLVNYTGSTIVVSQAAEEPR